MQEEKLKMRTVQIQLQKIERLIRHAINRLGLGILSFGLGELSARFQLITNPQYLAILQT